MICHFAIFITTLLLASLAGVHTSEPKEIVNTIHYGADGIHFSKTPDVEGGPWIGGAFRPATHQ